jgi:hypothetical protein
MTDLTLNCAVDPETDYLSCRRYGDGEIKQVNIVIYNDDCEHQAAIVLSDTGVRKLKEQLEAYLHE